MLSRESFFDLFYTLSDRGLRRSLIRLQRAREVAWDAPNA